jgi:hypothetical protein
MAFTANDFIFKMKRNPDELMLCCLARDGEGFEFQKKSAKLAFIICLLIHATKTFCTYFLKIQVLLEYIFYSKH